MNRIPRRPHVSVLAVAAVALLACTSTYQPKIHVSDKPDDKKLLATDGPAATCPPTAGLEAVRYGRVAHGKVPDRIGDRTCVRNVTSHLQKEIACARTFNAESLEKALQEQGLERTDHRSVARYVGGVEAGMTEVGQISELSGDAREQLEADRVIFLGMGSDHGCSSSNVHARPETASFLARDRKGGLVLVTPKPAVESRTYVNCSCFPGCGAEPPPPPPIFLVLESGDVVSGKVELPFPSLTIISADVESETCCCAP